MSGIKTNRDLYLAIEALSKAHSDCTRSLENYLLAFLESSQRFADRDSLALSEFYELVSSSFSRDAPLFNNAWRKEYNTLPRGDDGYVGFRSTLIRQIVDLREMDEAGILKNELRYFGVRAPRKSYWFNFDPPGYLECAMTGAFGGWELGDDIGRQFVPGPVAVVGEDGSLQTANPEDVHRPTIEMPQVSWEQINDFIYCGQIYE